MSKDIKKIQNEQYEHISALKNALIKQGEKLDKALALAEHIHSLMMDVGVKMDMLLANKDTVALNMNSAGGKKKGKSPNITSYFKAKCSTTLDFAKQFAPQDEIDQLLEEHKATIDGKKASTRHAFIVNLIYKHLIKDVGNRVDMLRSIKSRDQDALEELNRCELKENIDEVDTEEVEATSKKTKAPAKGKAAAATKAAKVIAPKAARKANQVDKTKKSTVTKSKVATSTPESEASEEETEVKSETSVEDTNIIEVSSSDDDDVVSIAGSNVSADD